MNHEDYQLSGPDEARFRYPGSVKQQEAFLAGATWGAVKSVMTFGKALRKKQEEDMEAALEGSEE